MSQTILITGANRGIGLSLTRELLAHGHQVIATARTPEKSEELNRLRDKHSAQVTVVKLDVASEESIVSSKSVIASRASIIDVLVNNAAIFPEEGNESILDIDLQHFRDAFETNVLGPVRVTRAFLPLLEKSRNPRVVNISSGAGSIADKDDSGYYAYATSKAALNMVTRAMAAEFRSRNICVVAMTPGWVKTEMGGPNALISPEESARDIAATITSLTIGQTSQFIERTGTPVKYGW